MVIEFLEVLKRVQNSREWEDGTESNPSNLDATVLGRPPEALHGNMAHNVAVEETLEVATIGETRTTHANVLQNTQILHLGGGGGG